MLKSKSITGADLDMLVVTTENDIEVKINVHLIDEIY